MTRFLSAPRLATLLVAFPVTLQSGACAAGTSQAGQPEFLSPERLAVASAVLRVNTQDGRSIEGRIQAPVVVAGDAAPGRPSGVTTVYWVVRSNRIRAVEGNGVRVAGTDAVEALVVAQSPSATQGRSGVHVALPNIFGTGQGMTLTPDLVSQSLVAALRDPGAMTEEQVNAAARAQPSFSSIVRLVDEHRLLRGRLPEAADGEWEVTGEIVGTVERLFDYGGSRRQPGLFPFLVLRTPADAIVSISVSDIARQN